jgi:hypothetical protein
MLKRTLAGILALAATAGSATEVYRVVEADGTVRYSDRPPNRHARPIQLPPLSGAAAQPGRSFYSADALRAAARFAVSVESPTPGQRVPVGAPLVAAASVMPGLVSGFRLVYLLPALPAGDYALRVVLLDPQGREIARSEESRFAVSAPN